MNQTDYRFESATDSKPRRLLPALRELQIVEHLPWNERVRLAALIGVALLAPLLAGCAESTTSSENRPQSVPGEAFAKTCPLFIRVENPDGSLEPSPFIRPEHVQRISAAAPLEEGDAALMVELTDEGTERMTAASQKALGGRIAIFCGKTELIRPAVLEPFGRSFRLPIPRSE